LKKSRIFILLLVVVILLNGCNGNTDEKSNLSVKDVELLQIEIDELKDELERKGSEIDSLNSKVTDLNLEVRTKEDEYTKLKEMNESLQVLSNDYIDLFGERINKNSIYNLSQSTKLIEFKEVQGTEVKLYIFPSEKSQSLMTLSDKALVEVLAYVNDSDYEPWALVVDTFSRGIGVSSMGYVKVDNLRDIEENPTVISEHNLQEVRIGDPIEELIVLFGRNYSMVHDDYYTAIVYDNLSIYLDRYGYYVNSVDVNLSGHNEFTFDGKSYQKDDFDLLVSDLESSLERYYGNEETARDANMIIDFIEFSLDEKYTVLVRFDENNTIVGISMGSSGWLY